MENQNNYVRDNFIKREKRRRHEISTEVANMRSDLPSYDLNEIRKYKLPYHEALILELQQKGYIQTEMYLKQLFDLQEQMRMEAGPQSAIWLLPMLHYSDAELKKLSEALKRSEDLHNQGNFSQETDCILEIAVEFSFNVDGWWWLGQQLLLQCISNSTKYANMEKREALSRYVYAKLLIEKAKDYENAEHQLNISRELSAGKSWNASKILPGKNEPIFMSCNHLLYLCLIKQARQWAKTSERQAIEFANLARKRANEACYYDGETEALLLKGQCELNIPDTKSAISSFAKAYHIQSRIGSEKGMCQTRVELSKAYIMHGNTKLAIEQLLLLKEKAEEHNLNFYLAQAYRYLGEYYLNNGDPYEAISLLSDSLKIFYEIGHLAQADDVSNLAALAAGLHLMPDYVNLLSRTSRGYPDGLHNCIKLVDWKDSRIPFWDTNLSDSQTSAVMIPKRKDSQAILSQQLEVPSLTDVTTVHFTRDVLVKETLCQSFFQQIFVLPGL